MRSKNLVYNMIFGLIYEIFLIVGGLLLPRFIILFYGSSTNGALNSISQFLSMIVLLKAGVGGVSRAALYKPIKDENLDRVNAILSATQKFMRKVSLFFGVLSLVLASSFAFIINNQFSWLFSFTLVLIISLGTFAQYYFGITIQIFLEAKQKLYVWNIFQTAAVIVNIVLSLVLIFSGCSIHAVKIASALCFSLTPVIINIVVKKRYGININVAPETNALHDKWAALGHQISRYVIENADIILLTVFLPLTSVSVYAVYALIIHATIRRIIETVFAGFEPAIGDMLAKHEDQVLDKTLSNYEFLSSHLSAFLFTCTYVLIFSFIEIYTNGVTDANYFQPIFCLLFVVSEFVYCLRLPYLSLTNAAGLYRETSRGAYIEAIIDICVSISLVWFLGLIGVMIGKLIAITFRTIDLYIFTNTKMINRNPKAIIRYALSIVLLILVVLFVEKFLTPITTPDLSIINWVAQSLYLTVMSLLCYLPVALLLCTKELVTTFQMLHKILKVGYDKVFVKKYTEEK